MTFGEAATACFEAKRHQWRNEKHGDQWRMTLDVYAASLHEKPVDTITTADILAILKPIWTTKPETASRVRGRVEMVLDYARALGTHQRRQGQRRPLERPLGQAVGEAHATLAWAL